MDALHAPEVYDVIVVGSGANGGVAAKELGEAGLKVLVLEAGPDLDPFATQGHDLRDMGKRLWRHFVSKRQTVQEMHGGYWDANPDLFVDDLENPYTTAPGKPFYWIRGRQVGGRSLTWGGLTMRLSDHELKPASKDGVGVDWPIGHADLAPWYSRIERFLKVHGAQDGLSQLPDGDYVGTGSLTPAEQRIQATLGTVWPDRPMIVARGIKAKRAHKPTKSQPWSGLSSNATTLAAAKATGNVTVQADSVCYRLTFDPDTRKATGVAYIHRVHRTVHEARARSVVLTASTIESVRLLLASTADKVAGGIEDASGSLGRYLMGHISMASGVFLPSIRPSGGSFDMLGSDSFIIPRFRNLDTPHDGFLRGYGMWGGIERGAYLPAVLRKVGEGTMGNLLAHGECLPQAHNTISLDPTVVDAWGIPVARMDCAWGDNELAMAADMRAQMEEAMHACGGQLVSLTELFAVPIVGGHIRKMEHAMMPSSPGLYVHEVGGARMSASPEQGVLNPFNQVWGTPNVFVTDGAAWPTSAWQNPTLTEMAVTARACAYLRDAMVRREL